MSSSASDSHRLRPAKLLDLQRLSDLRYSTHLAHSRNNCTGHREPQAAADAAEGLVKSARTHEQISAPKVREVV